MVERGVRAATQFSVKDGRRWKAPVFTIWGGQALSILGSQLVQFALVWYLTVQTGSATVLATASLVGTLPQVIVGPFVGTLVDRSNRRWTMLLADSVITLATIVLAILFALDRVAIWHVYMVMLVRSLGGSFHSNAMSASTSLMVPVEDLTRVQGVNQSDRVQPDSRSFGRPSVPRIGRRRTRAFRRRLSRDLWRSRCSHPPYATALPVNLVT